MTFNLSYRQQLIALGLVSILFLYLLWERRIIDTVTIYNELQLSERQLELADRANDEITALESEKIMLDKMIGDNNLNNKALQEYLMVEFAVSGLKIDFFPEYYLIHKNGFEFITQQVRFQGTFHDILKTVHAIENDEKGLKVMALRFETKTDRKLKMDFLYATCFIQSVNRQ
jgi:hypothetical protein